MIFSLVILVSLRISLDLIGLSAENNMIIAIESKCDSSTSIAFQPPTTFVIQEI
jgi:hypothetical protein